MESKTKSRHHFRVREQQKNKGDARHIAQKKPTNEKDIIKCPLLLGNGKIEFFKVNFQRHKMSTICVIELFVRKNSTT